MEPRYDENSFDQRAVQEAEEAYQVGLAQEKEREEKERQRKEAEAAEQAEREAKAEGVNNFGDVVKETAGSVAGGAVKAVSEVITTPERIYDLATGQIDEDYKPDWDPLGGIEERFKPKTWWGNMIQEATSFASVFVPVAGQVGKVGKLSKIPGIAGTITRGAVSGTVTDLLREDTTTKDGLTLGAFKAAGINIGDNAATRTAINVAESMGIGMVADRIGIKIFGKNGLDDVSRRIADRNADVAEQTLQRGKEQLKEPGVGGYKNKPIVDQQQGNVNSRADAAEILEKRRQIEADPTQSEGSTPGLLTEAQTNRAAKGVGMSDEVFLEATQQVVSSEKIKVMIQQVKDEFPKQSPNQIMSEVLQRLGTDVNGRVKEMTVDDVSKVLDVIKANPKDVRKGQEILQAEDIITADLLIGSLSKITRDMGIAAREAGEDIDVFDKDGIMDRAFTTMKTLLYMTKKARRLLSQGLSDLKRDTILPEADDLIKAEVDEGIDFLRQLIKDDTSGDISKAITEFNSMGGKIANYEDLDNWARKTFNGYRTKNGASPNLMLRELNSLMINSVLSSPKTPLRALIGTVGNTLNREAGLLTGALVKVGVGDTATGRIALAEMNGMVHALPEAWKVFKKKLNAYWSNDTATMKTRFVNYEKNDRTWDAYGKWVEARGTDGEKAAYRFANMVRGVNNNNLFTYSSKLMAATDDAFRVIIARGRARSQAMTEALANNKGKIDQKTLAEAQERFYKSTIDANGNVDLESDAYLKGVFEEATLTADLDGFAKRLDQAFDTTPALKPFFMFARTGINGLAMTMKNTPLLNIALKKQRHILTATAENMDKVKQYGINTAQELATEKALIIGRQSLGAAVIFSMGDLYQAGKLHGNGPNDRSRRQARIDGGWRPKEINIGGTWVSTSFFEPYSTILDAVADVYDNMHVLGEKETENQLLVLSLIAGQAAFDRSYLQSISQLIDVTQKEGTWGGLLGTQLNNLFPLSSLRNDLGKLITPYMLEHNRQFGEILQDRNRYFSELPIKYSMLEPKPIRDWHWTTRLFNMVSPVQLNLDYNPGTQLLIDSDYDLRTSVNVTPDFMGMPGIKLYDYPKIRSMFQKAIGEQNPLKQLNKLAENPRTAASLRDLEIAKEAGEAPDLDPQSFWHNEQIKTILTNARKKAWASIVNTPEVQELITQERERLIKNVQTNERTSQFTQDLILPNR